MYISTEKLYEYFLGSKGVSTDTRSISQDQIYVALKGGNFDGNKFAQQALDAGAAFAVVDDPEVCADARFLLVENTLKALQELALHHRRTFSIPVLGITGSNGKTTTKELVAAVLGQKFKTHVTKGNLNNHIGVPLTLLSMPRNTEFAVIEMGANKPGDIKELCDIAEPSCGLITNIGKAHLEGFGSLEGVARTKSELYLHLLKHNGTVFVNTRHEHLLRMSTRFTSKITYPNLGDTFEINLLSSDPYLVYEYPKGNEVKTNLVGVYNFDNIATALCVGDYFKVDVVKANTAIANYVSTNNRSQILEKGSNTIIMDAYNANPESMKQAILSFSAIKTEKSKRVILGDMFELGEYSNDEHANVINTLKDHGIQDAIFCGKHFYTNRKEDIGIYFEDIDALKKHLSEHKYENEYILLKGSRGIGLERIVELI